MNDLNNITYCTRYKTKNTVPDGRILVFVTGFFLGLVFFYFAGKQLIIDSGLLSPQYMEALKIGIRNQSDYLFYIAGVRIKQWLFILFCSLSIWSGYFLYAVLGISGFQFGILFFAAMYQYGIRGVFYCIFMLLPQGIFYVALVIIFLNKKYICDKKYYHNNIDISGSTKGDCFKRIKKIFCIVVLLCLGILSESYINPLLMKWILLFF